MGAIEYVLIAGLIAVAAMPALTGGASKISALFDEITDGGSAHGTKVCSHRPQYLCQPRKVK